MTVQFRPAKRESVGLLIGIAGASGSGKSFSALRLARGLAGDSPFCVIDTEARRMLHYADQFQPWEHADLHAPFTPAAYSEAITTADAAGYPVIVVDSASHIYAGEGGILDAHEAELNRMAGDDYKRREALTFAAWVRPKSEHKRFVSKLLQLRSHLILCFRAEEKIEIVKRDGRTVVQPKKSLSGFEGWMPVCEKSLPYELTLSLLLTPDAPGIPKPIKLQEQHRASLPLDQPISEDTGRALAVWAAGTAPAKSNGRRSKAPKLTSELLALAEQMGQKDKVAAAVQRNRQATSAEPGRHEQWLEHQLERAREAAQALATVGAEAES